MKKSNKKEILLLAIGAALNVFVSDYAAAEQRTDLTAPITEDVVYNEDTVLDKTGEMVIKADGKDVTVSAGDNSLIIHHENGAGDSLYAANGGKITVNAGDLVIQSGFTGNGAAIGVYGENSSAEINSNLYIAAPAGGKSVGIEIGTDKETGGNVAVKNDGYTYIYANGGNADEIVEDVDAVRINGGKFTVETKKAQFISQIHDTETAFGRGLYVESVDNGGDTKEGIVDIKADEIVIGAAVLTDNTEDDKENSQNAYGLAALERSKVTLTGENVRIFSENSNGEQAIGIMANGGNLEGEEFNKIQIDAAMTVIEVDAGNLQDNADNMAVAIKAAAKGNVEINGGLQIKRDEDVSKFYAVRSSNAGSNISLNKDNEQVFMDINGDLKATAEGRIDMNLNGGRAQFTGNASIGDADDGFIDLGIANGAVWNNEGDSHVSSINLEKGIIDMSRDEGRQVLTADKLSGNSGSIIMDISGVENERDFISIKGAEESIRHEIVAGISSVKKLQQYDFGNGGILMGEAADDVTFTGGTLADNSNIFDYTIGVEKGELNGNNLNNWYVNGIRQDDGDVITDITDDLSLLYMNAETARMEMDSLHQRLGEIRNYKDDAGVWFRTIGGSMEYHKAGTGSDYHMLQLGYDRVAEAEDGRWFTGFAVSRREDDRDLANGSGEGKNIGLSLYRSFAGNDDTYIDLIARYQHIDNEFSTVNKAGQTMQGDYDTWAGSVSAEYGKTYTEKNNWYLTPHAQLNYTHINGADYMTSSGIRAFQDDIDSLTGKLGLYAGKKVGSNDYYLKAGILHEFAGDYGVAISGADGSVYRNVNGDDTWFELGLGGTVQLDKKGNSHFYYDVAKTFAGDFETEWQITAGLRYSL